VKKIATILLAIFIAMAFFVPQVRGDNSTDQYQALFDLPKQMSQLQLKLKAKEAEKVTVEKQIATIDKQLQQVQSEIKATDDKMESVQFEIDDIQWEINQKQKGMDKKKDILKACIQETYEENKKDTLEILISSNNLSDFMDQMQYVYVVGDKTKQVYDDIKVAKEELDSKQQEFNDKNDELVELRNKKEVAEKTIQAELISKQIILGRIQKEEQNYQKQLLTPKFITANNGGRLLLCGIATWYGPGFEGGTTASGEPFDPLRLAAAHRTLPLGSLVKVTNLSSGLSCVVVINDRGPFSYQIIDLTRAAADAIGMESVAPVILEVL